MALAEALLPGPFRIAGAALLGAILGSFVNVVIHRLPRKESIVFPPSRCPSCGHRIAPWDNVPVVSWLLLGGRCRSCRARISIRYPLVETAAAGLTALVVWRFGFSVAALAYTWFSLALLAITLIDLEHRIIPDAITLPGIVLGFLFIPWTEVTWVESLTGAAAGFAFLLLVGAAWEKLRGVEAMGGGDIKMAAMMGAFIGWKGVFLTIFIASFLGSVAGLVGVLGANEGSIAQRLNTVGKSKLPFGTFLAPAAVITLFAGPSLIRWYLDLVIR